MHPDLYSLPREASEDDGRSGSELIKHKTHTHFFGILDNKAMKLGTPTAFDTVPRDGNGYDVWVAAHEQEVRHDHGARTRPRMECCEIQSS